MKLKKLTIELLKIICGTVIMATGTGLLLVPNKLSTGGFSGIATVFYYLLGLPVGTMTLILNIPLFIYAYIKLGKRFILRSLIRNGFVVNFY